MTMKSIKEAHEWMEANLKRDPVECAGCTACCQGNQVVCLNEDYGDDPNLYPEEHLMVTRYAGEVVLALRLQPNGDCFYLRKGKCMIYDKRPAVCRGFDCRRATASFTEEEREQAIKHRVFSKEVFEAGDQRRHTMKLSELEKNFYDTAYDGLKTKGEAKSEK